MTAGSQQVAEAAAGQSWRWRLCRYGPVACWLALNFWLSTEAMSPENTIRLVRPVLVWLVPGIGDDGIDSAHAVVRKAAHATEYAVFALLIAWPLMTSSRPRVRDRWFALGMLALIILALVDEIHQTFVPSRHASLGDSLIDVAGGLLVLTLLALWRRRRS